MTESAWQDGAISVYLGDSLEVMRSLPDASVDAVVTDPPYGLAELKPAIVAKAIGAWLSGDRSHVPDGRGFMGRSWDAFTPPPAVWDECMRVLKPGGHLLVFAGSRTVDLMGLAIRLAGFEIRDTITWMYGSGFPKSLDVSKAIDRRRDDRADALAVAAWLAARRDEAGWDNGRIDALFGFSGMAGHWTARPDRKIGRVPRWDQWCTLKDALRFGDEMDAEVWRLNGRKGAPGEAWAQREVIGQHRAGLRTGDAGVRADGIGGAVTAPATDDASRWVGWGTALKPASEPIVVARKPLAGTVAQTVLAHGTGALNIDGCRVGTSGGTRDPGMDSRSPESVSAYGHGLNGRASQPVEGLGRWPSNVVLSHAATPDGADLCADECVPGCPVAELDGQSGVSVSSDRPRNNTAAAHNRTASMGKSSADWTTSGHTDSGGASRFFPTFRYEAKAPSSERPRIGKSTAQGITNNRCAVCGRTDLSGSPCTCPEPEWIPRDSEVTAHPTVKPLGLMRWLVRLVTPPGGVVLDPFLGSGTTAEACLTEGKGCVGIERDAGHLTLIRKRLDKPIQLGLEIPE